ncbi:TetR family transcriptional regulator [Cellulomonas sp. NPDC057328]|uniref:TetR family transcriptional regulator n=1 Tax=Cellulomonas sp. NPDC057328 TaxID=3346101 RepID=UPI003626FA52
MGDDDGQRHPGRDRGDRRRAQLVAAGVEVLAERGWAAMTARAVAERAGTHAGLIHYHFGGFAQLKRAVAAALVEDAVGPLVDTLARSDRWPDGLADAVTAGAGHRGSPGGRVAAELITASLQDADVRGELAPALRDARDRVAAVLAGQLPGPQARGLATVVVAALDGLLLHSLIDDDLDLAAAAAAVRGLRTDDASGDVRRASPPVRRRPPP